MDNLYNLICMDLADELQALKDCRLCQTVAGTSRINQYGSCPSCYSVDPNITISKTLVFWCYSPLHAIGFPWTCKKTFHYQVIPQLSSDFNINHSPPLVDSSPTLLNINVTKYHLPFYSVVFESFYFPSAQTLTFTKFQWYLASSNMVWK